MSNNSTIPIPAPCTIPQSTISTLSLISYYITCPICFTVGFTSQTIGAIACHRESKKTVNYLYQTSVLATNLLTIGFAFIYVLTQICCGALNTSFSFYTENYSLMWYRAHLAVPLVNIFSMSSFLLLVAASADRLLTFIKPYTHATYQHYLLQKIYLSSALVIGISTSIFDIWRSYLTFDGVNYKVVVDSVYTSSLTASVLSQLRNGINIIAILALIICNTTSLTMFLSQNKNQNAAIQNDRRLAKKKEAATTLLLITVSQAVATVVTKSIIIGYYYAIYAVPSFASCGGKVVAPVMDFINFVYWIVDFFVTLVISRQFREMVKKVLPWSATSIALRKILPWSTTSTIAPSNVKVDEQVV